MKKIGTNILHTPRLTLRKLCLSDALDLYTAGSLGETLAEAEDIVNNRKGRNFVSIEEFSMACPKVSKSHVEQGDWTCESLGG